MKKTRRLSLSRETLLDLQCADRGPAARILGQGIGRQLPDTSTEPTDCARQCSLDDICNTDTGTWFPC